MKTRLHHFATWVVPFCLLALLSAADAQAPVVDKVEPPNWWIGLPDPMVMMTGEHLAGARVSTRTPGIHIARTMDGLGGRYEFVWIEISGTPLPGKISLDLTTESGRREVDLPLERRNPAGEIANEGDGFNGVGPADVIYLIMPDRFDDG
ncbi:MAG: cyclomaltodextrinase N-terminal domain-containing protein, partial [Candidatus Sulfotelmatobacter sp.]